MDSSRQNHLLQNHTQNFLVKFLIVLVKQGGCLLEILCSLNSARHLDSCRSWFLLLNWLRKPVAWVDTHAKRGGEAQDPTSALRPHRYLPWWDAEMQRWIYILYFLYGEEPLCQRIVMFSWVPFDAKLWKSVSWFDRWFTEKQCLITHLSQLKAAVCHCYHKYQQVAKISRCIQFNTQYTWQDRIKYGETQNFWAHQRLSMPVIRTYRWLLRSAKKTTSQFLSDAAKELERLELCL